MLIHLEKLGKTFGEKIVLHDVTASVEREDRIGIVGQNGAGKTTLLKILTGEYTDYEGEFSVTHGVTLGYLEQNAKLDPTLDIYGEMRSCFAHVLDAMAQMQILERRMAASPEDASLLEQHDALQNIIDAADGYNMDVNIKKVLSGMGFAQDTWTKNVAVLSGGELTRLRLAKLLLHLLVPIAIIHVQGDDGTAIIYGIIGCCMMFAAGLSWKYIFAAFAAAGAAVAVAFAFFSDKIGKGYQWYRILAVLDPENTTGWAPSETVWKNIIYQQQRGEIALGSGGIFGNGLFGGRYYSVPNAHNDFILSWIGNVAGFVGCCVVLGVLLALVIKTFSTGARSEDLLGSYICAGIGGALMAQIAVNVGMNLRVLPVIGVTLPFYSAGGSSVLMLYICVGLVLSVYSHNTKSLFS